MQIENKPKEILERRYLPPTLDIVFQRLFGREESKEITKDFLEHILGKSIETIDLSKTKILERNKPRDKQSILDVRAEINGEENCNVEMQMVDHDALIARILFYWSKMFQGSIHKGDPYSKLKKTVSILIANFSIKGLEELEYHTKWKIIEEKDRIVILTDLLEIHIIELPKIQGREEEKDGLLDWLFFLRNPESERTKKGMEENEKIQDAEKELAKLKEDEELEDLEFREWIAEMDRQASIDTAERRGKEKGEKEEKRNTARKLLKMKMSIQDIMQVTELTEEEIKQIQEESKK